MHLKRAPGLLVQPRQGRGAASSASWPGALLVLACQGQPGDGASTHTMTPPSTGTRASIGANAAMNTTSGELTVEVSPMNTSPAPRERGSAGDAGELGDVDGAGAANTMNASAEGGRNLGGTPEGGGARGGTDTSQGGVAGSANGGGGVAGTANGEGAAAGIQAPEVANDGEPPEESAAAGGASGSDAPSMGGAGSAGEAASELGEMASCERSSLVPGDETRTLDVDGTLRTFIIHVPPTYDGTTPTPLVFDFHGSDGTGSEQQRFSGMQQVSDREGFLVAFPNSLDGEWNVGPCCSRDDDLSFTRAMLETIAFDGCVDRKRVYSTGFSMGGGMSHFLACEAADFIAAATPAAFDHIEATEADCAPSRPVSVLSFRGTEDHLVPFEGGLAPARRLTFLGAHQTLARWAEIDGCTEATTTWNGCTLHTDCSGGVQVGLCVDQGGGHAYGDARISWDFLRQFSLP